MKKKNNENLIRVLKDIKAWIIVIAIIGVSLVAAADKLTTRINIWMETPRTNYYPNYYYDVESYGNLNVQEPLSPHLSKTLKK